MTQSSPRHRSHALIVEDEPLCVLDLEAHMHELGFDSHLVANGQEAFVQSMSNEPDIVLMDVNLEGSHEGIEVAKKLRETCEARIVFVTGYTDPDSVNRIRKEVPGAPIIPKPVWGDRLADAVKAVMTFRMW